MLGKICLLQLYESSHIWIIRAHKVVIWAPALPISLLLHPVMPRRHMGVVTIQSMAERVHLSSRQTFWGKNPENTLRKSPSNRAGLVLEMKLLWSFPAVEFTLILKSDCNPVLTSGSGLLFCFPTIAMIATCVLSLRIWWYKSRRRTKPKLICKVFFSFVDLSLLFKLYSLGKTNAEIVFSVLKCGCDLSSVFLFLFHYLAVNNQFSNEWLYLY